MLRAPAYFRTQDLARFLRERKEDSHAQQYYTNTRATYTPVTVDVLMPSDLNDVLSSVLSNESHNIRSGATQEKITLSVHDIDIYTELARDSPCSEMAHNRLLP